MIRTPLAAPQMQAFFRHMAASTRAAADVATSPNPTTTAAVRAQLRETLRSVDRLEQAMGSQEALQ